MDELVSSLPARIRLAGLPIDPLERGHIEKFFVGAIESKSTWVLAHLNLHGIYSALRTPKMRQFLNDPQTLVHADGRWVVSMLKPFDMSLKSANRQTSLDYMPGLFRICIERNLKVMHIGSNPEGAIQNEVSFRKKYPGLEIHCMHGYFDIGDLSANSQQSQILHAIRTIKPALLLVGMGMPRQELWIEQLKSMVQVAVTVPVGGLADYVAGRTKTPPRWSGPLGMEWLFRLFYDPKRLAFRYLVEPLLLVALLLYRTLCGESWGPESPGSNLSWRSSLAKR